jgi:hypothetical protein
VLDFPVLIIALTVRALGMHMMHGAITAVHGGTTEGYYWIFCFLSPAGQCHSLSAVGPQNPRKFGPRKQYGMKVINTWRPDLSYVIHEKDAF